MRTAMKAHVLLLLLLVGFQNCFQIKSTTTSGSAATDGVSLVVEKIDCKFVSVPTLQSMLRSTLGLPQGDTAILNSNGQPTSNMYISVNRVALGGASAIEDSCASLKYKLTAEIMINACEEAPLAKIQSLFPQGASDFSTIYLTFLGRNPSQDEVQILRSLVSSVSSSVAERSACAAVGSSIETLARN